MPPGLPSLSIRSSPASRNLLQRATRPAHVPTHGTPAAMLSRGIEQGGSKPPASRPALAKQLFPSSSPSAPNGDVRDQFKKLSQTSSAAAPLSARTAHSPPNPFNSRSVNTASSNRADSGGPLQSLYGKSDPFKHEASFIDLTKPTPEAKTAEPVWFAEDDFSDDDNLDLDFQAPTALPSLPPPKASSTQAMRPPPPPSQSEIPIPWSSSPASHLLPPKSQPSLPERTSATPSLLKRESSGESIQADAPVPKKAKKRTLPASFRQEGPEHHILPPSVTEAKTPASKSRSLWDTSASAIKEQKKQLKSQRNQALAGTGVTAEDARVTEATLAPKAVSAISLSREQRQVLDLVINQKKSVFFTGPAGTGKSVLMRAIIADLKEKWAREPEKVAVTASTGLAACNIGGMTLHSFAGIGLGKEDAHTLVKKVRRNPKAKKRWINTKYLIIDEVSMVDGDLFDKLSHIGRVIRNNGRPWGGIQLIITGDFFQLPPVPDHDKKTEGTKFAFDAATWSTSIDHTIGLTQVFRQRDPEFARMLNEMRLGKISQSTVDAFKALARPLNFADGVDSAELYPTRAQVDGSNERRLRELPGQLHRYEAMDNGDPAIRDKLLTNMMAPKTLDLKLNAQVMLIKNLDETLVNGSLGKVVAFSDEKTYEMMGVGGADNDQDDDVNMAKAKKALRAFSRDAEGSSSSSRQYPVVQFISTGGAARTILCQPEEWKVELPNGEVQAKRSQLPLILAWALSIHKAQGQTLERVTVNLGKVFEKGQAYVALSRATCKDGLRVLGFDRSKVMAHDRVVDFYGKLYTADQANGLVGANPSAITDFLDNRLGMRS
ncbi:hypothetical protein HIM_07817 [Hirsutella minnesotensis 3608]|uniref:ATP-dependent DNA helicase PIF1 n=1 Tax=Hirsutella minnesotensis 3608 TaxID=1043627 RepID=A0A0F7ZTC5_9HYPO|nr:hypothetical protein HIM_07817 [Hirsutella minnesotensis 3608]